MGMKAIKKAIVILLALVIVGSLSAGIVQAGEFSYDRHTNYSNGKLYLYDKDGDQVTGSGWTKVKAIDYFSDKVVFTSWVYLNKDSTVCTGWKKIGGYWYYFNTGAKDTMAQGSFVGQMNYSPEGYTTVIMLDGDRYSFKTNGQMRTGWVKASTDNKWYYMDPKSGKAVKGWKKIKGSWYYFDNNCQMMTGTVWLNNKYYFFKDSGVWIEKTGWHKWSNMYTGEKYWSYLKKGVMQTGWKKVDGTWYYFNKSNGIMVHGRTDSEAGAYFSKSGAWVNKTGWQKVTYPQGALPSSEWIYLKKGYCQTGWKKISGKWYYFVEDYYNYGHYMYGMVSDGTYYIDGKYYTFNKGGAWVK